MALTLKGIKEFKFNDRTKDIRWDSKVSGLGLRIYPPDNEGVSVKSFVLKYRIGPEKTRLMVLGRFGGDMTLEDAREEATEFKRGLRRNSIDPLEEKKKQRTSKTFGSLWEAHKSFSKSHKKKTLDDDISRYKRHIPKDWDRRPAASITAREIGKLHKKIGETHPYEANRVLSLLRSMFRRGATAEFDILPLGHTNPAAGIEKFREHRRRRFATRKEMPRIAKAIDAEENVFIRAALWLYLLTGARKTELLAAKWEHVDLDNETLRLPDTKSGDEQKIPLSKPAIAVLKGIPRFEENPYVFPGARPKRPLVNIFKAWRRIRERAGCPDLRLHDLRRSVGSWMTQSGVEINTIKEALRHADISTTLIYAQLDDEAPRKALERHGQEIMSVTGKREETFKNE